MGRRDHTRHRPHRHLPANPTDPVSVVANRMRAAHSEAIAFTNANTVIGVVTLRDLTNVEVLLDRMENESS